MLKARKWRMIQRCERIGKKEKKVVTEFISFPSWDLAMAILLIAFSYQGHKPLFSKAHCSVWASRFDGKIKWGALKIAWPFPSYVFFFFFVASKEISVGSRCSKSNINNNINQHIKSLLEYWTHIRLLCFLYSFFMSPLSWQIWNA